MTKLVPLSQQVFFIVLVGMNFDRYIIYNLQAISHQSHPLLRVICDQPDFGNTQIPDNLRSDAVITFVHIETQLQVGFNGVKSLLLQSVGFEFIEQANPPPLLLHI